MKEILRRYKHALLLLYFIPYMIWFNLLEQYAVPVFFTHCRLDDFIPFCAAFIIPYLLWFPYVAVGMATTCLRDKTEFIRLCIRLYTGMTICLILYTVFPSGQLLRPDLSNLHGPMTGLIQGLYGLDDSSNVCPSIHVYNTLCIHFTLCTWEVTRRKKLLLAASWLLTVLIIASTVLLKQHSVIDGFAALGLWLVIEGLLQWSVARQRQRSLERSAF